MTEKCSSLENVDPNKLEEMIGNTITINPQALLNKKRLYSTQKWIDLRKLESLYRGKVYRYPPKVWLACENKDLSVIVGDGNHRVAFACMHREKIDVLIEGTWPGGVRYGFNIIIQKIQGELGGSSNIC